MRAASALLPSTKTPPLPERARRAPCYIALCLTLLLLFAVRNAWDLVTWLVPRRE